MSDIRITGFEMIEMVGEGGMATVWKARQISLDRVVAIKILSEQFASDPADIERFQTEARAAARLKHPGIVQVYDANAENGKYFFVMEFVAGYTIGEWLRRKGKLPESEVLLVAECVANALGYAWESQRIVHCDIKPDNVMIDADGTVKVTDLGLARTLRVMTTESPAEDITGTPFYISPEQAAGEPRLDCRADIYSLGATLYHALTGTMLFEGHPDVRVMEMHATETVPDPLELNAGLSKPVCWLIERMLAKNREQRPRDWEAVKQDIARVRRGRMPAGERPPKGASTVRRCAAREAVERPPLRSRAGAPRPSSTQSKGNPIVLPAVVAGLFLVLIAALAVIGLRSRPRPPDPALAEPAYPVAPAGTDERERRYFEAAMAWIEEHPSDYAGGVERLRRVIAASRGTRYESMAADEIKRLAAKRRAALDAVLDKLEQRAQPLVARQDYEGLVRLYEEYEGPLAFQTAPRRHARAHEWRQRLRAREEERRRASEEAARAAEALFEQRLEALAGLVLEGDMEAAVAAADGAVEEPKLAARRAELVAVQKLVHGANDVDRRVMESFLADKGRRVTVDLLSGRKTFVVTGVRDGKVWGKQYVSVGTHTASIDVSFALSELAPHERLRKMGSDDEPEVALVKGIMAFEAHALERAGEYFARVGTELGPRLLARVRAGGGAAAPEEEDPAVTALRELLRDVAGVEVGGFDRAAWLEAVAGAPGSAVRKGRIGQALERYRGDHGTSEMAAELEPLLRAVEGLLKRSPDGKQRPAARAGQGRGKWKRVDLGSRAVPVVRELLEQNPGLAIQDVEVEEDGEGRIVAVRALSPGLKSIAALAAARDLKVVAVGGADRPRAGRTEPARLDSLEPLAGLALESLYVGACRLRDLKPLRDMPLRELDLRYTGVTLLPVLKGMPLEHLVLRGAKLRDIAPLSGLPLRLLDLGDTSVYEIRALKGMEIERLWLDRTQVKQIAPLKDMPLKHLDLGHTGVYDFGRLAGLPLESLNLAGTQIRELDVLKDMPLKTLMLQNTRINDLDGLQGGQLVSLNLAQTLVKDLEPLRGMPLRHLNLAGTRVTDLEPLRNAPLDTLELAGSPVRDLWPLAGSKLRHLGLRGTNVRELGPVGSLQLVFLDCRDLAVRDLAPLERLPVERILVDSLTGQTRRVLNTMPRLRQVNGEIWPPGS